MKNKEFEARYTWMRHLSWDEKTQRYSSATSYYEQHARTATHDLKIWQAAIETKTSEIAQTNANANARVVSAEGHVLDLSHQIAGLEGIIEDARQILATNTGGQYGTTLASKMKNAAAALARGVK